MKCGVALVTLMSCVLVGGCKVYKAGLVGSQGSAANSVEGQADQAGAAAASTSTAGRGTALDAAANAGAAQAGAAAPAELKCQGGECWWSHAQAECRSAGRPMEADRPEAMAALDAAPSVDDIYLGWTSIWIGERRLDGAASSTAWQTFGFDLDGRCTNSETCANKVDAQSCKSASSQIPFDGALCRDNSFASLQPMLASVPEIADLGISESVFNCNLWRGTYNVVLKLSGYNGAADDSDLRVDFYMSTGLERLPPWKCEQDNSRDVYPLWSSASPWQIDRDDLTANVTKPGVLPDSKIADVHAFVRSGYLVATIPDGAVLRLAGRDSPYRGFAMKTEQSVWAGKLSRAQDSTWQIHDGIAAGRVKVDDLVQSFRRLGLCPGTPRDAFYQLVTQAIGAKADVLASGDTDADKSCDALSIGVAFEAAQLTPGAPVAAPALVECCPAGVAIEECTLRCGDGKVSGSELCDDAIAKGQAGACPTTCPAAGECMAAKVSGTGCDAHCVTTPITAIGPMDGCCPPGANRTTDTDCMSKCGNGVIEPGETCDPAESCPTCASRNKCVRVSSTGSAAECNLHCDYKMIDSCRNGDGCCPTTCTSKDDSDCAPACGNGVIEANETCEKDTDTPCPDKCDDAKNCTKDIKTGDPASCNVACTFMPITSAADGDSCCPDGQDANSDKDCMPKCGNFVKESGEDCDDGNMQNDDGCDQYCKKEDLVARCLALTGVGDDACARCTCEKCQEQTVSCFGATEGDDAKLCSALRICARTKGCSSSTCYCGTANPADCGAGLGNGVCRTEVEMASRSTNVSDITMRGANTNYPVGRANALANCAMNSCPTECAVTAPTP